MSLTQTEVLSELHHCTAGPIERELATIAAEARARLWPQTPTIGPGRGIEAVTLPTLPKPKPDASKPTCMDLGVQYTPTAAVSYSFAFSPVELLTPCRVISMHELAHIVCNRENITEAELRGPQRKGAICEIRAIFCYLTYRYSNKSTSQIGKFLSDRDHTTIIHSRDKAIRKKKDPEFAKKLAKYEKLCTQRTSKQD